MRITWLAGKQIILDIMLILGICLGLVSPIILKPGAYLWYFPLAKFILIGAGVWYLKGMVQ